MIRKYLPQTDFTGLRLFLLLILFTHPLFSQSGIYKDFISHKYSDSVVHLVLSVNEDKAIVINATAEKGNLSYLPGKLIAQDFYRVFLYDKNGEIVYASGFRNPALIYYDDYNERENRITGGIINSGEGIIDIKIPYLSESELQIISPGLKVLFKQDLWTIIEKKKTNKNNDDFGFETILNNGDPGKMIDLLIMGDGYAAADTAKFRQDVLSNVIGYLMNSISPFKEYQKYFNVHILQLISEESGIDHPELNPPVYRNTFLDATYNYNNLARLIGCNTQKVYAAADSAFPEYDKIIVLINDDAYGGSGGNIAIAYTGYYGSKVLAHEFGHSFGGLLDEYLYTNGPGYVQGCNCDNDASDPLWKIWIEAGTQGVGMFDGCSYNNYFRPTYNGCMMNILKDTYCPICREAIVKNINIRVNVIKSCSPADSVQKTYLSSKLPLFVDYLIENNENLVTSWYIDYKLISGWYGTTYEFSSDTSGIFSVAAVVSDTTSFVLNDPKYDMLDYAEWTINVLNEYLPVNLQVTQNFPNPYNSSTSIKYYVPKESNVTLRVYNPLGEEVAILINEIKPAGWYQYHFDGEDLSSSVYFYSISDGSNIITKKMILLR